MGRVKDVARLAEAKTKAEEYICMCVSSEETPVHPLRFQATMGRI